MLSNRTKKSAEIIENEKNLKKCKKFSKRVFTNTFFCGKLWEKSKWGRAGKGKTFHYSKNTKTLEKIREKDGKPPKKTGGGRENGEKEKWKKSVLST